ncbi:MAG: acyltransferase [Bdellovibrionia bacterium]
MAEYRNTAPGFDALRLILATLILFWHSFYVCYSENSSTFHKSWAHPIFHPLLKMILPMFFFLSGFLVSTSAFRLRSTLTFLLYRAFRIFPALLVEVFISAVFLGAIMTDFSIEEYYSHDSFYLYFKNIVGNVQFFLPGVFRNHPISIVNANLWTLPAEFYCYAIMAGLMFTRIFFIRRLFLLVFSLGSAAVFYMLLTSWTWGDAGIVFVRPPLLVCSFLLGVFCFIYSDKIRIAKPLFCFSVLGLGFFDWKYTTILGVLCACYLCLCIGFVDLRRFPLIKHGDYSYGIYLYGFPIEQAVWHALPIAREWWVLFLIAFPVTLVFSIFSWRVVEQPFLKLKRHLNLKLVSPQSISLKS